jgi:hypothetical protein
METIKQFPNVGDTVRITCLTHLERVNKGRKKRFWANTHGIAKVTNFDAIGPEGECKAQAERDALVYTVTKAQLAGGGTAHDGFYPDGWYVEAEATNGDHVAFYVEGVGYFTKDRGVDPKNIRLVEYGPTTARRIAELDVLIAKLTAERVRILGG